MKYLSDYKNQFITLLSQFWNKTCGSIALYAGIAIPTLLLAAGIGFDYALIKHEEERIANALDAAGLAAASSADLSESERKERMQDFFDANYEGDFDVDNIEIDRSGPNNKYITLTVEAEVNTTLIGAADQFFGADFDTVTLTVQNEITRELRGIEAALVLDVTGSMSGSDMTDLRNGANDFVDIAFDNIDDPDNIRISLVPYAATVNVGDIAPAITPSDPVETDSSKFYDPEISGNLSANDDTQWLGCVDARGHPHDTLDTPPSAASASTLRWDAYWWEPTPGDSDDNPWETEGLNGADDHTVCNNRRTPNLGCPERNPIVPLSSDKTRLETAIDDLVFWCRGGTLGNIGAVWGWRTLSDKKPFDQGSDYDNTKWRKVLVMMTDGNNQIWKKPGIDAVSDFSAYGRVPNDLGATRGAALTEAENRMRQVCTRMKNKGIIIYSITFGVADTETQNLYQDCAGNGGRYINTSSGPQLINAFNDIASELSRLHISQ